jgi:hypothetical protein
MAMFGSALPLERPGAVDSDLVNALKTVVLPDLGKPNSPIFIFPSPNSISRPLRCYETGVCQ